VNRSIESAANKRKLKFIKSLANEESEGKTKKVKEVKVKKSQESPTCRAFIEKLQPASMESGYGRTKPFSRQPVWCPLTPQQRRSA
jgi:hypothetical protein